MVFRRWIARTHCLRSAIRSRRFIDAYHNKGLNGAQAAWAARKYRGHRVLPSTLMADLNIAKAKRALLLD
ncbi:hypothetical protein PAXINDRAFT_80919 [Paxillus involutus ATCC 200175]|uniref:Unplaced genomic scaffold PAXINscaffold_29, whole genome shotgun sequence n=1 Tax=Paxillus involutus ATCC 200175 TaxID=664439 RepID=A0A0C9TTF7_PAXIN|nr:hypothetical protein PAXINDRAFT_80919 [Paxillus involutus ATCC 200175]